MVGEDRREQKRMRGYRLQCLVVETDPVVRGRGIRELWLTNLNMISCYFVFSYLYYLCC